MVNHMGALLLSSKDENKDDIKWWQANFIGFIDGAWKKDVEGNIKGGIGGYLVDSNRELRFLFSGPQFVWNPYEAELNAILFLVGKIKQNLSIQGTVTFYTDSLLLVDCYQKMKVGIRCDIPVAFDDKWMEFIKDPTFRLDFMSRANLRGADDLAKKGRERSSILWAWC